MSIMVFLHLPAHILPTTSWFLIPCQVRFCFIFKGIWDRRKGVWPKPEKWFFFSLQKSAGSSLQQSDTGLVLIPQRPFLDEISIISNTPHRDQKISPNHILMDKVKVNLKHLITFPWNADKFMLAIAMLDEKHLGIS